jgi:hypothetical protein
MNTAIKVSGLPPPLIIGRGKKKRSLPTAAIVGGVGGLIALAAVTGTVILLIKRNKVHSKGNVAAPTRSNLTATPPHSQPCGTPPSIDNAGQKGCTSGNGPSVRSENCVTSELLGNYGRAPADTVSVTYIGGEHRHAVTTRTGSLVSFDCSTLNESSSPADILNAQLDYITEARGGMLSRFVKCATLLALLFHAWVMSGSVWLPAGSLRTSEPLSDLAQSVGRCQLFWGFHSTSILKHVNSCLQAA